MLKIIREAEQLDKSPAPPEPEVAALDQASDETCAAPAREAAADIANAQFMEKNVPSCSGLLQAAENYLTAGRICFGKIKLGTQIEEAVKSCALKKTNELFLRRDALNDRVAKMKAAGLCDAKTVVAKQLPPDDDEAKKKCVKKLEILRPRAPDAEWLKIEMARGEMSCDENGKPL